MSHDRLPIVSEAVVAAFCGEVNETQDFEKTTWKRLQIEQPVLSKTVDEFMHSIAGSGKDLELMAYAFVLTYRLLESQVDAESMIGMFAPEQPES
jgi:hypothetical protein